MNKSPFYLNCLRWFLLVIGGINAAINTSLTANAAASEHSLGSAQIGIGIFMALLLTVWEAVIGHVASSFASLKDLLDWIADAWLRGALSRIWLCIMLFAGLVISVRVYQIDTVTTFTELGKTLPVDWAATFSFLMVFACEVCMVVSSWVERQRKKALRSALEADTGIDADIAYHQAKRRRAMQMARQLGAQTGMNQAQSRYAKNSEGR